MRINAGGVSNIVDGHELHLDTHYDPTILRVVLGLVELAGVNWRMISDVELMINEAALDDVIVSINHRDHADDPSLPYHMVVNITMTVTRDRLRSLM